MNRTLASCTALCLIIGFSAPTMAQTAEPAIAEPVSSTAQAPQLIPIDYTVVKTFMDKFSLVERGRPKLDYDHVREVGKPFLTAYINYLGEQDLEGRSQDEQLAHWLNVQNFLVIQAITEDTKKSNLKKLRGTGDKPGPLWTKPRIKVGDQLMSIEDVEAKILANWKNPNVLYGMYQGVKGGPCLSRKAYAGENVQAELDKAAKQYINSNGIVRSKNSTAEITPIFFWYQDELFEDDAATIAHLRGHAKPQLASALYRARELGVSKLNYKIDGFTPKDLEQLANAGRKGRSVPERVELPRQSGGYGS